MSALASNRYPGALLFSTLMHGGAVVLLALLTYVLHPPTMSSSKIMVLVAGEGDNYAATEAPALGTPGGATADEPAAAADEPEPAAPAPLEAVPMPKRVDPARKLENTVRQIAAKRAEEKREAARQAKEEAKRAAMTKAEFDKANKNKPAAKANAPEPPKVAKIDGEGIAGGVTGGSTANTTGGAGGKALRRDDGGVMDAYYALFKQRIREAFEPPPGLSDSLVAKVTVTISAGGALSGVKISKSSGSPEFDNAVRAAITRVQMPASPDQSSQEISFDIRMHDLSDG
jgi:colicin import membrane protein